MTVIKRKLIEVALPLDAINRESSREKSIRHGHPSTMHLWWARRPLAACRAVLFAQLVDDPSANPDQFPTVIDQSIERQRLFDIIERLVVWENTSDEGLLRQAHDEIVKSIGGPPPPIFDPFAGGGSIPLEAQRLGLEAHASDLNPVAVLINKGLIEVPPQWAGCAPVFPEAADARTSWIGLTGLAEDVRRYGQWMLEKADSHIGDAYPPVEMEDGRPAPVVAWLWTRTAICPNPACGIRMPLMSTLWLTKKKSRPAWVVPSVVDGEVVFEVRTGVGGPPEPPKQGRGALFKCVACETVTTDAYIKREGSAGRLGLQMVAIVAAGDRRRIYLSPQAAHVEAALVPRPEAPEGEMPDNARWFSPPAFGMTAYSDIFTNRQLLAMTTFSGLVQEAGAQVVRDAIAAGLSVEAAEEYGRAVSLYLAFGVSRLANRQTSICIWNTIGEKVEQTFGRQAIPMSWDFAEANVFASGTGSWSGSLEWIPKTIELLPAKSRGEVAQLDAQSIAARDVVFATDPPYYDNIGYSDLSDFFYLWLRESLGSQFPSVTGTLLTPKVDELIASPSRFGGSREAADQHFESGFLEVFTRIREGQDPNFPVTLFYAFKQAESDADGVASTGWETMLNGLIAAGLTVTATWPMHTERDQGLKSGTNVLASSIVLACRTRDIKAEATTRRGLIAALSRTLPQALREMQQGSVAPVDLAQAAIGPGMAVYSSFSRVTEADGSDMSVRTALALINQVLDEALSELEGDFDSETRFCLKWFSQFGWNEAPAGEADVLARAVNSSVRTLERGGIFRAAAGRARLLEPKEMSPNWDPSQDKSISVWEVGMRISHALRTTGVDKAAEWMQTASTRIDIDAVKELAYLIYSICEKRGWTESAMLFNGLGTSWSDIQASARGLHSEQAVQEQFLLESDD